MWGWVLKKLVQYVEAHPEKLELLIAYLIKRVKSRKTKAPTAQMLWSD